MEGACEHPSETAVCKQCATERRAEERAKTRADGGVAEARPALEAAVNADVLADIIDADEFASSKQFLEFGDNTVRETATRWSR